MCAKHGTKFEFENETFEISNNTILTTSELMLGKEIIG